MRLEPLTTRLNGRTGTETPMFGTVGAEELVRIGGRPDGNDDGGRFDGAGRVLRSPRDGAVGAEVGGIEGSGIVGIRDAGADTDVPAGGPDMADGNDIDKPDVATVSEELTGWSGDNDLGWRRRELGNGAALLRR